MKKELNFNIQFSNLWRGDSFPNCLAGVHSFFQGKGSDTPSYCNPNAEKKNVCFGCGGCDHPEPTSVYFCLFDTICGRSALRLRFDYAPTVMGLKIGDGDGKPNWSGDCATDYTTDFLFGFAGYDYRKITDVASFKTEVIASIDAGKPVIAGKAVSGGGFRVITGYDGDNAVCSFYNINQSENKRELDVKTLGYGEFKALYIIKDKIAPRYTLKDGLERIKSVMESSMAENIWEKGVEEITKAFISSTDDEYGKMDPEKLKLIRKRYVETVVNQFNNHTFSVPFFNCKEFGMGAPELAELWDKMDTLCNRMGKYDHSVNRFNDLDVSRLGSFRAGYGRMLLSAIEEMDEIYSEKLRLIKLAIEILSLSKDQREEYVRARRANKLEDPRLAEEARLAKMVALQPLVAAADAAVAAGKAHNIELTSLTPRNATEHKIEDGKLTFTVGDDKSGMFTPNEYKSPVRINLRAMTDRQNLRLYYGSAFVILNWEINASEMPVKDIKSGKVTNHQNCGKIPANEFVDVEWTIGRDVMAVKVNGELRHAGDDYDYIRAFAEDPAYAPSFPIRVTTLPGNTITVESLRVTELQD